jgi:UDP-N-acetylmuramoyl-L-alanyl-D-glutamate--2,6-diaminopimelate ligase
MEKTHILRSDYKQIQFGDDYLCLERHSARAASLVYEARLKGARKCFSWHKLIPSWHHQLTLPITERNQFIDDYYGPHPALDLIAITGTNGKTSTTCLIQRALELQGYRAFLLGTIGLRVSTQTSWSHTGLTTPDYADLRAACLFAQREKIPFLVMEASSHALAQRRLGTLSFLAVGATMITFDDHLDFHKTNHHYLKSKARLFLDYPSIVKVLAYNNPILSLLPMNVRSYYPKKLKNVHLKTQLQSPNIQLTQELLAGLSISSPVNLDLWVETAGIKGRFEFFYWSNNRRVIVDFAHTPEALNYLLSSLKEAIKNQLWLVFGCGGQRDRTKRHDMVRIAQLYADFMIITADNPRHERFEQIVHDMCSGSEKTHMTVIQDRKKAIAYAYNHAPPGSLIVIAGKGHESCQVIGSRSIKYSDLTEVLNYG